MVCRTRERQILCLVTAAVFAMHHVMEIDVTRGAATRDTAFSVISTLHEAPHHRRDVLRRALGFAIGANALRIAFGALDIDRVDRDHPARGVLPALVATLADRDHQLVPRASLIHLAAGEVRGAQGLDQIAIVDEAAGLGRDCLPRLPQLRGGSGTQLERDLLDG